MLNKYLLGDFSRSLALPERALAFIPGSENLIDVLFFGHTLRPVGSVTATVKHACGCDGDDAADKAMDVFSF